MDDSRDSLPRRLPYLDTIAIVEMDGWGLYHIKLEWGRTPKEFEGRFTSMDRVEEVINKLQDFRRKNKKVLAETKDATE